MYGKEELSANFAFPYILLVNNLSQFIAMYCLVLFYQATKVNTRLNGNIKNTLQYDFLLFSVELG